VVVMSHRFQREAWHERRDRSTIRHTVLWLV
jgi:hypothetical protein